MKTPDALFTDNALLLRLKQGDKVAFEEIYNRHWQFLFTSCQRILDHEDDSLDVCQSVFMSLWENREALRIETSIRSYLYGAIKYKIANLIRRGRARFLFTNEHEIIDQPHSEQSNIELQELKRFLHHLIEQLPPKCREVFMLSRYQHMSHKEIALKLGISEKTVDDHISRALKILRPSLQRLSAILLFI